MTDDFGPDYNRTDSDTRAGVLWTDHSECQRTIDTQQAEIERLRDALDECRTVRAQGGYKAAVFMGVQTDD